MSYTKYSDDVVIREDGTSVHLTNPKDSNVPSYNSWIGSGNVPNNPPSPTPSQILAEKKAQRQAIVDAITVTTSTGKVFDGNEDAQSRMSRAIQSAQIASIPSTTWVLANNVPTTVTLAELQEALVLSMQAMGAVWATPYE